MGGAHHGHSHAPGADPSGTVIDPARRRVLALVAGALAVGTFAMLVALWPSGAAESRAEELGLKSQRYRAEVVRVVEATCEFGDPERPKTCVTITVRPAAGLDTGADVDLPSYTIGDRLAPDLSVGDDVIVGYEPSTSSYFYADRDRRAPLQVLAVVFAIAVVLLGRLRGLAALIALGLTVAALLQFVVPAILVGESPLVVSVVGASAIAFAVLYLANGVSSMSTVALLGTLGSLLLTAFLAWIFFAAARFSGAGDEEVAYLSVVSGSIDVRGLLLGGAILGALGALDDMTVTQASAVYELRAAAPQLTKRELFASAMRIGRDHVGSTVNTLLLAYAGASLPLLLLFVLSGQSLGTVANSETVAVEIVRTLVGSIGLVAAVPLTTALATWAVRDRVPDHMPDAAP